MFRKTILLTCFVLAMGTGVLYAAPFQQSTGPDAIVAMEAEHFTTKVAANNHSWELVGPTGGFTGAAGMQALPNSGTSTNTGYVTGSPHMDFEVNFQKTGTYYVWIRAWGPDGSGDSCHAGLDGQVIATADRITSGTWTNGYAWTDATADNAPATFDVATAGIHVVNIYMREDGLIVDKILLTTNPDYTPTGDGPPENPLIAYGPKPANGAIEVTDTVVEWTPSASAVSHKVYLSKDQTIDASELVAETPATLQIVVVDPGTTYYWRVDEVQPDGSTAQGDVWNFTTMSLLAHFPDPSDGRMWVRLDAKLSWTAGQKAILHNVYLGTNPAALPPAAMMQLPTSFTPAAPLTPNTTYYWRVDEFTPGGTQAGPVWSFKTIDPAVGGAVAEYWANRNLDGAPAIVKIVPEVNFDWGDGPVSGTNSPDPNIPTNNFSCRWSAELQVPVTGTYTLYEASDDGARMFLNGVQVASGWVDRGTTEDRTAAMELVAGQRYLLVMEMYENGGGATAFLRWEGPGYSKDIIPQGALMPPQMAFSLSPRDGATGVSAVPVLSWLAGDTAVTFNVYLGTDSTAVTAGDASVLLGQRAEKSLALTSALTWGGKYYWKVDAVLADGTILPGIVSSFTVTDRIVIEDFENYDVLPVAPVGAPVAQYAFEGNAADISGNGNDGTINGNAPFVVGHDGSALDFDGKTAYVSTGKTASALGIGGNNPRTVAAWVFTRSYGNGGIFDVGNRATAEDFSLRTLDNTDNRWRIQYWGGDYDFTYDSKNKWVHFTHVHDGARTRIYADGRLIVDWAKTLNTTDNNPFQIGRYGWPDAYFDGLIDDLRVYKYALSPAEAAGLAGFTPTAPLSNTWVSSGTATAVLTVDGPHGGAKAMSIQYQNSVAPFLGEVSAVPSITDMTMGAGSLLLWVRGDPANGADPIYVSLQDSAGVSAVVVNPDPLAAQDGIWTAWIIPLKNFTGVNLASVAKLSIGVGNGQPGGAGAIVIDDTSLVKPVIITEPADVTSPGDDLRGVPNDGVNTGGNTAGWPAAEAPRFTIDNSASTKFLHFKGEVEPTGIQVTPSGPQSIVTGLTFTTANDAAERDPIAFELHGSNVGINGPYELIAAGQIVDFNQPTAWPRFTQNATPITFVNTVAYDHYQVMFPRVRTPASANSMQIAEIELIGTVGAVAKPKVIWVSFHGADDAPSAGAVGNGFTAAPDIGYTDLLKANGYDVTRYVQTGTPDPAILNAADLVIVGRSVASASFQNAAATRWNTTITAPMMLLNGYTTRRSRLGFNVGSNIPDITGNIKLTVNDLIHPIFAGIALTGGVMDNPYAGLAVYPTDGTAAAGISVVTDAATPGGTVLATLSAASGTVTAGSMVIAEWPAGATVTHDTGAVADVLAGPRLVFLTGSRENGGKSSETAGMNDLTADGAQMFLNAVAYMVKK